MSQPGNSRGIRFRSKEEIEAEAESVRRAEAIGEMQRVHSYRSMVGSVAGRIFAGLGSEGLDPGRTDELVDASVAAAEQIITAAFMRTPGDSFQL